MRRRGLRLSWAAVFALASTAAPAQHAPHADREPPSKIAAAVADWHRAGSVALAGKDDPRSAYFAASFRLISDADPTRRTASDAAFIEAALARARAAGDDRVLQWLLAYQDLPAHRAAAVAALERIDAGNAFVSLFALARAANDAATNDAVAAMASATTAGIPWPEIAVAAYDATANLAWNDAPVEAGVTRDPEAMRAAFALSYGLAFALPSFDAVVAACEPSASAYAARRAACRKVAALLARGDAAITRSTGALLQHRLAETEAERDAAIRAVARNHWRMAADAEFARDGRAEPSAAESYAAATALITAFRAGSTELEVQEARLKAHGIELEPPAAFVADTKAQVEAARVR